MKLKSISCFFLALICATNSMAHECNEDFFTNVDREEAAELAGRTTAVSIFALLAGGQKFDGRIVSVQGEIAETESGLYYLVPGGSQSSKYLSLSRILLLPGEAEFGCFISLSVSGLVAIFGTFHVHNEEYSIRDVYYARRLLEEEASRPESN